MPDTPNVLLLWTDQHRRDAMGAYGNDRIETPNLDRLATEGTVFERAYCSQPVCTPSRASIMTGRYPSTTGVLNNGHVLSRCERCLPEFPPFEPYATGFFGKWDLGDEVFAQHGFEEWAAVEDYYRAWYAKHRPWDAESAYGQFLRDQGFEPDQEDGFGDHPVDAPFFSRQFAANLPEEYSKPAFLADRARSFLRRQGDEPFLLSVNFLEPHHPFHSPRDDQYDRDEIPLPSTLDHDGMDEQGLQERRRSFDEAELRDLIARYWGLVSLVDTHMGRILDTLSAEGLAEDTVVVYTSDHGEHLGNQGMRGKGTMFEASAGVPLVVRHPDHDRAGERVTHPVSQVDLVPTLVDAVGGSVPDRVDGRSWMPWFRGAAEFPERDVLIQSHNTSEGGEVLERRVGTTDDMFTGEDAFPITDSYKRAVVTSDLLKYVYRSDDRDALYDLEADPQETRNLAADPDHADTVERLRARLARAGERIDGQFDVPGTA